MKRISFLLCVLVGCVLATPGISAAPTWTNYPAIRSVGNLGPVLTDIESHLRAGHPYRNDDDKVNWVHEGTHGLASYLRNQYHRSGFYCLQNRAILMLEPSTTLDKVASAVPTSLRGRGYNLYLIHAQRDWQNQPTYVFDEWSAFTNGSEARNKRRTPNRTDTLQSMVEFIPYAICVLKASQTTDPQIREFVRWQIERALTIYNESGIRVETLNRFRKAPDAEHLRQFTRSCFGADWTRTKLGF